MQSIHSVLPAPTEPVKAPRIDNQTPFPAQYFQMADVLDQTFHVVALRQTYSLQQLDENNEPILVQTQQPLCTQDEYYDQPHNSSLIQESDLAPFKPRCDVIFNHAVAYAPQGKPQASWPVGVQLGGWEKLLTVTGPRFLERTLAGDWDLTKPEPCTQVPIRYEHAWGGTCRIPYTATSDDEAEQYWAYPENSVGCGFAPKEWVKKTQVADVDAPQLEVFKQPLKNRHITQQNYPVVGLGAISRWWSPRLQYAGTYDERWKKSRWPGLPEDFEFDYWNCAPQDQQIPYPEGGEQVALHGLLPEGILHFQLPTQPITLLLHLNAGIPLFKPMHIDTVIFNMQRMELGLVYRAVVAAETDVAAIDIGHWDLAAARTHNEHVHQEQQENS